MGNGVAKQQSRDRPRKKNVHWKTAGEFRGCLGSKQEQYRVLCAVKIFPVSWRR